MPAPRGVGVSLSTRVQHGLLSHRSLWSPPWLSVWFCGGCHGAAAKQTQPWARRAKGRRWEKRYSQSTERTDSLELMLPHQSWSCIHAISVAGWHYAVASLNSLSSTGENIALEPHITAHVLIAYTGVYIVIRGTRLDAGHGSFTQVKVEIHQILQYKSKSCICQSPWICQRCIKGIKGFHYAAEWMLSFLDDKSYYTWFRHYTDCLFVLGLISCPSDHLEGPSWARLRSFKSRMISYAAWDPGTEVFSLFQRPG